MPKKANGNAVIVYYDWDRFGYSVEALDLETMETLDSYEAGNNRNSSDAGDAVSPDSINAVKKSQLRLWAIKEARKVRKELGARAIERDTDLRQREENCDA